MTTDESIIAYKAFNADFSCHPSGGQRVQYAVGETATYAGAVEACKGGLHACERPLDVLAYYPPATSRFAVVRMTGKISRNTEDSKVAAASLTVEAEIGIPTLVQKTIEWVLARCTPEGQNATGVRGASSATGVRGASSATGESGASSATGVRGASITTGRFAKSSATGAHSVACGAGRDNEVMGVEGAALFAVFRDATGAILHARAAIVGKAGIKPDTWYALNEMGKFVKAPQ